jgi:hypothetical protein
LLRSKRFEKRVAVRVNLAIGDPAPNIAEAFTEGREMPAIARS